MRRSFPYPSSLSISFFEGLAAAVQGGLGGLDDAHENNTMRASIRELVSNGRYKEAIFLYGRLHASAFKPDRFTFPFLLKACGKLPSVPQHQRIHTHLIKTCFRSDFYTATALTSAYAKLHLFDCAIKMFNEIPSRTLPSYNAIISGFSQTGRFRESMRAFKQLEMEGLRPDSVTIASLLPACETVEQGSQLHGLGMKMGLESDVYVSTALVTMYLNCGKLCSAQRFFGLIEDRWIESYNAMISGCLRFGSLDMALDVFREMMTCSRPRPNSMTLLSLLSVCSELSASRLGKEVHCYLLKCEASSDVMIATTLIDMYSKCGLLNWAYRIFMKMDDRNLVTWNSMLSGMLSHGRLDTAVKLFHQLKLEDLTPDSTTWNLTVSGFSQHGNAAEAFKFFIQMQSEGIGNPSLKCLTSLLQACSSISDLRHGEEIHGHVMRTGADFDDEFFQTALIDMYMKCGRALHARKIFDQMEMKSSDPAVWNAMISGYGRNGENDLALEFFGSMQERGVEPTSATFLSALCACSHAGQVDKGLKIFSMMIRGYGVNPTDEHFSSIIDLLSRHGKLVEAWDLMQEIAKPSASMYSSLLGACRCHSDAKLGELMAERISKVDPHDPTPLVLLSNIYAIQGRWNNVESLRKMLMDKGLHKIPGYSLIDVA